MAPVQVGDTLPDGTVWFFDAEGNKVKQGIHDWAKGKKVVLFGVPGAFTPTCSLKHLPGFIEKHDELKKHVDAVACISVNDPFVMREWGKGYEGIEGKVALFADGDASYTKALGFDIDLSEHGLGLRSRRFALVADDLAIRLLHLEEGGAFTSSGADQLLQELSAS